MSPSAATSAPHLHIGEGPFWLLPLSGILLRLLSTVDGLVQRHSGNNEQPTKLKVCKSVHHHTIQINQPTRRKNFSSLLLDVYVQLNMFRASSRPSSGAQQLQ